MINRIIDTLAPWLKPALGFIAGAALCFPLAYCEGKGAGKAEISGKVEASARALIVAARKVEEDANLLALERAKLRAAQSRELQEIAHDKGTNDPAGAGVRAVLGRVHERQTGGGDKAAR
tara:strand:+ start:262 stop:621 length:360 start_codon:yes stop_codon:yes gene_type:complete